MVYSMEEIDLELGLMDMMFSDYEKGKYKTIDYELFYTFIMKRLEKILPH